jgi:hypothetical protein
MMIPTGAAPQCSGPRPIVLYAHGTTTVKSFNLAAVADPTNDAYGESALIGAMFAAQGYIVVAPNYAGYDASTLSYHPYLNADQQSKEMIDALTAARSALGHTIASGTTDNGRLFITGYSQGGHVALATAQAMEAANPPITYTAVAPMSGPYALEAFGDAIFYGNVNLGSTEFTPLLTASYQNAYNIYSQTTDIFSPTYATGIDTLTPSLPFATLVTNGKLPQTALFDLTPPVLADFPVGTPGAISGFLLTAFPGITPPTTPASQAPLFALGFASSNYLITNSYRASYLADAALNADGAVPTPSAGVPLSLTAPLNKLRLAFKTNDLRSGASPTRPMLLCGGNADPTVFYSVNTGTMGAFWSAQVTAGLITVLDVDSAATGLSDPFALAKGGFAQTKTLIANQAIAAGATDGGAQAITLAYHGTLVPPFCTAAARGFFNSIP